MNFFKFWVKTFDIFQKLIFFLISSQNLRTFFLILFFFQRMLGYVFNDLDEGLEKPHILDWWGYGCWCMAHGENQDLALKGDPKDEVDS